MRQARADLRHARHALDDGDHEWSAFAAQQAAEKAVKAVFEALHMEAWGHTVSILLDRLPPEKRPPADLIDRAKRLDKHYVPARYPNGFEQGAPVDFYTAGEARAAIEDAEAIVGHCQNFLD